MCPESKKEREQIDHWLLKYEPSANGSGATNGPTSEPSLSGRLSEMTVRLHRGLSHLSVTGLTLTEDVPGTFTALKRADLDGFTVMLSCALTSSQYAALISNLEGGPTALGENASVGVVFEPSTPNLVRPTIALST